MAIACYRLIKALLAHAVIILKQLPSNKRGLEKFALHCAPAHQL